MPIENYWGYCDDPDQNCNGVELAPACDPAHGKCSLKPHHARPPESEDPPWRPDNDCTEDGEIPF